MTASALGAAFLRLWPRPEPGRARPLQRLVRIRTGLALIMALPALTMIAWYSLRTVVAHQANARATASTQPLTFEVFQLHLHDQLRRDVRRLWLPERRRKSALVALDLVLGNRQLDQLDEQARSGKRSVSYVKGLLAIGHATYPVGVRHQGAKAWHSNRAKRFLKVRLDKAHVLGGHDALRLSSSPEPLGVEEQVILDLGREVGLLAPLYRPVRLLLNATEVGLYVAEAPPDEAMLRERRRYFWSLFSGDGAPVDPATGVSSLFSDIKYWKQVVAYAEAEGAAERELRPLLDAIDHAPPAAFAEFARRHLDLDSFAKLDALDVLFGCDQHDFDRNQKLYFDPYRARFEAVAWAFRGCEHRPVMNRTDSPLLLRLKELPGYLTLRDRAVWELLRSRGAPEAFQARLEDSIADIAEDQRRDPYWDAYHLLPPAGPYFRQLARPMDEERQRYALDRRLVDQRRRARFLRTELSAPHLAAQLVGTGPGASAVLLDVSGESGYRLERLSLDWGGCTPGAVTVTDGAGGTLRSSALDVMVYPGIRLVPRVPPHPARGRVQAAPDPRRYALVVRAEACAPQRFELETRNAVTGEPLLLRGAAQAGVAPTPPAPCAAGAPTFAPGWQSPHPWCTARRVGGPVTLGPGVVEIAETRIFESDQPVTIASGTTLRMGVGASLLCFGRLQARGSADAPIRFEAASGPWGGLVIQGPATAGSVLSHVVLEGGSQATYSIGQYPGLLSLHDTRDVALDHVTFGSNRAAPRAAALHVAYVENLRIGDCRFVDAASDAIDAEYVRGELLDLRILRPGDECLDFMGSDVRVQRVLCLQAGGSAISAGEETHAVIRELWAGDVKDGIHVKNASTVDARAVVIARAKTGLTLEPKSTFYDQEIGILASDVTLAQCLVPVKGKGAPPAGIRITDALGPDPAWAQALRAREAP